jgi:hypothetical protein
LNFVLLIIIKMRVLLYGLLAGSSFAYNRQNRLVRFWDNLAIYDDQGV